MERRAREASFIRREISPDRRIIKDALAYGAKKHLVHGLVEVDVTEARHRLAAHEEQTGEALSFTAWVLANAARLVAEDTRLHALEDHRGRLVQFDEVDVCTLVEVPDGERTRPHPCVLRAACSRSVAELSRALRRSRDHQQEQKQDLSRLGMQAFARMPGPVRRLGYRFIGRSPRLIREMGGTIAVTAVGMCGEGGGYGLPAASLYNLVITIGGISERTDRRGPREILNLTVSVNHDVVDGAPLARFIDQLRRRLESCALLEDIALEHEEPSLQVISLPQSATLQ